MPQSENIQCGVRVAVENRAACAAHPFSYLKTLSTFWTAYCAATGTGLSCEAFRHFTVHYLPRNRFVFEKVAEHGPSSIVHGFRHVRFCQLGTGHVADNNQLAIVDQLSCFLVEKIQATVGYLGVQVPHLARLALALKFGQPLLLIPIPARRFNLAAIGTGRQRFQPQVNTDLLGSSGWLFVRAIDGKIHVPPFAVVLAEAARLDGSGHSSAVPESESLPGIANGIPGNLDADGFERNPPRRSFPAPAQLALLELLATVGVLLAHGLNGLGMQAQFLAAAGRQLAQVLIGRPALIPAQRVFLRLVAEVPNLITRSRQAVERWHSGRILDPVAVGAYHVVNDNTHYNRNQHDQRNFTHENQPGTQRATSETGRTGRTQFIESGAKSSVRLCHAQRSRTAFGALCIPAVQGGAFRARLGKFMQIKGQTNEWRKSNSDW